MSGYPKVYYRWPSGDACAVYSEKDALAKGVDDATCRESPACSGMQTAPSLPYNVVDAYAEAQYWYRNHSRDARAWSYRERDASTLPAMLLMMAAHLELLAVLHDDAKELAYYWGTIEAADEVSGTFPDWLERQRAGFTGEHTLYLAYTKVLDAWRALPWVR